MDNILAKSNGITIYNHSKEVNIVSEKILNEVLISENQIVKDVLKISSLLHDIGKSTFQFQNFSLKGKQSKNKFRHNEIGWAFLYRYLNVERDKLDLILDAVYWHHGISNEMNVHNHFDILESITDSDIETMKTVLVELLGEEYLLTCPRDKDSFNGKLTPNYYYYQNENNFTENSIITRTCLISADRFVSENNVNFDINSILKKENNFTVNKCPDHYDYVRFIEQIEISKECIKNKTTIVKAPTGKGKTLIGLMCSSFSDKKLLWVCPRNDVAKNMYNEILKHLTDLKITNVKVELYLTGEVKKRNYVSSNDVGFTSDIIVTNIDNFLKPSVESRHAERLFLINTADVVFDEYHELTSEASLFASFVNIMRVRHRYSNCKTTLLSASPSLIHNLWDSMNKTNILPNVDYHYKSVHDKKYKIIISEGLPTVSEKSSLIYFNSIALAQKCKNEYGCNNLIHSDFQDCDKDKKFELLIKDYGKNSSRLLDKQNIVGTPILQASFDISFANIFMSVLSPESFIQLLGRCERWGDYIVIPKVNVFKLSEKEYSGENKMKDILYDTNLSNLWFNFIKEYDGQELTLDEIYIIYNAFNKKYESLIISYIRKMYNKSMSSLTKIYPFKFPENIEKSDILTAGANKLRAFGDELFVISKIFGTNNWTEPFSERTYDRPISQSFRETGKTLSRMLRVMKELTKTKDERFDYSKLIGNKNITIDEVRKQGKKSNTPYIRFDKIYHPDFGLIDENKIIF